jgi:Fe-S cluster biogenesis protein NfuA
MTRAGPFQSFRSLFIQTEGTPNDQALKFLPSQKILPEGDTIEYVSGRDAAGSPLARKLFSVDGVKTVMFGTNFITVEKRPNFNWMLIKPEVFSILTESLTSGEPLFDQSELPKDTAYDEDDDDVVAMIKELIFTRIRPAIQEDGGDIEFVSFEEDSGTVLLRLRGACRSCDSSSVTLKNGIESMLKHYIEEVEEVKQIEEDEEEDPLEDIKLQQQATPPPPSI